MRFRSTIISAAVLSLAVLAWSPAAHAQVNVNINTGPPAWGPPAPAEAQFYYIPEIDGYYDLYARQYIVYRRGQWVPVAVIDGYDPRAFHPVVLDYRGRQPWMYVRDHRARYPNRVVVVRRGLPPGQAKKMYREGYREGRYDDRHDHDRYDDDRGHGKYKKDKGHGKGHDRD